MLSKTGVQRLTDVEIQQHREKGLCYRYVEKFSLGLVANKGNLM